MGRKHKNKNKTRHNTIVIGDWQKRALQSLLLGYDWNDELDQTEKQSNIIDCTNKVKSIKIKTQKSNKKHTFEICPVEEFKE